MKKIHHRGKNYIQMHKNQWLFCNMQNMILPVSGTGKNGMKKRATLPKTRASPSEKV